MTLAERTIPITLQQGIDTKTSRYAGIPGRLTELENGVFTTLGEIRKRHGQDRIVAHVENGDAISHADGLATFRGELLCFGSHDRVYSLSGALDRWIDRGQIVSVEVDETMVVRNSAAQSVPDVARGGGLTCVAWEDSRGGVRVTVTDDETGAVVLGDAAVNAFGTRVRVVSFDDAFWIFYSGGIGIFYRKIAHDDPTTLTVEQNPIATMDATSAAWDVAVAGDNLAVMWLRTVAAGSGVEWVLWDSDVAVVATGSVGAATAADAVAVWTDESNNAWFAWSAASTQRVIVISSLGASVLGSTTIGSVASVGRMAGCVPTGTTTARILIDTTAPLTYTATCSAAGAVSSAAVLLRGVALAGRPFSYGARGAAYVPVTFQSSIRYQDTLFVVDASTGRVVAKAAALLSGGTRSRNTVSACVSSEAGIVTLAAEVKTALESSAGGVYTRNGVELVTLDFTTQARYLTAELGGNLLIAGGVLHAYDGATVSELGFHCFPEGLSSVVGAGLGTIDAGSHSWRAVYEHTDAQGNVHRSAPSDVETVVTVLNDRVTLTIPTLRLTSRANVRIAVYRTVAAGSVYFRLGTIAATTLNVPTADSVTYVDDAADADILGNEILYTDGTSGQDLVHVAPPASRAICTHRGRAFLVTGRDRISYSKQTTDGEAVAFNQRLYLLPDARGGALVAVASMDDKLVIFREHAIYVTAGDGPTDTGAGGYAEPVLVTSDAGCTEVRSVVMTNAGLMFKSSKGIYILARDLSVNYIGAPVEAYNALTITSANVVPNTNQVRFTTSGVVTVDTEDKRNIALVYDYAMGQWATFTNYGAADATVWGTAFVRVQSNGRVYRDDPSGYDDDGAHVRLRFTTTWLSFAGVQGYQRVWRALVLGDFKGAHSFRVRVAYDFSPGWEYDESIDADAAVGAGTWGDGTSWGSDPLWGGAAPVNWFQVRMHRQKCSSIRFRVEDAQTQAPYNEALSISNLALKVGVKRGTQKLPATRAM